MKLRLLSLIALISCAACGGNTSEQATSATTTTASADSAAVTQPADGTAASTPADTAATGAAATGQPKACDLVSAEDLSRITGKTFTPGQTAADMPTVSQCGWDQQASSDGGVSITLYADGAEVIKNTRAVPAIKLEPLKGVGDEAYLQVVAGTIRNTVMVRKGKRGAQITLNYSNPDPRHLEEIARLAVQKI